MRPAAKAATAVAYVLILFGLGATDAYVTDGGNLSPAPAEEPGEEEVTEGVKRNAGPNIFETLTANGIVTDTTREESLIEKIVPRGTQVESRIILQGNDRLAYFAWVESPDVKAYFSALKEALHTSFSSELQDLVDEVQQREGKPVRNVLSFLDPAIHEERILFVRVRQRLFEFHVAPGREAEIQGLMDALTE